MPNDLVAIRLPHIRPVKLNLAFAIGLLPAFLVLGCYAFSFFFPPSMIYENARFQSILDGLTAYLSLNLAVLLVLLARLKEHKSAYYSAAALLSYGILRLINAMTEDVDSMQWFNTADRMVASIYFAFAWTSVPEKVGEKINRAMPAIGAVTAMIASAAIYFLANKIPSPVQPDLYSSTASNICNVLTGALLLFAFGVGLIQLNLRKDYDKVLLTIVLFFSIGCLLCPFTYLWGPRWWLLQILELVPFLIAFIYKFSVYKKFQGELLQTSQQLARSNQDLEQFAYMASHDLQEPLRTISSHLTLVKRKAAGKLDESTTELLDFAVDGAGRMQCLIRDLLKFSQLGREKTRLERVSTSQLLEEVLFDLRAAITDSGARIEYKDLPPIHGNRSQLHILFQNLISNSLKYHGQDPPVIKISATRSNSEITFTIEDNGIGFDMAQAHRIFLAFHRLHRKDQYPGTGIGLASCKRIVDFHGGRIWANSQEGKGSQFHFILPV